MPKSANILKLPDKFDTSPLLLSPPTVVPTGTQEAVINTTLSATGAAFAFAHGRAALLHKLRNDCIAPADQAHAAYVDWHFADPAQDPDSNAGSDSATNASELHLPDRRPTLPAVIGRDGQGAKQALTLFVPANLRWFDGHFPADPILPAVVQIDWVMHFGTPGRAGGHDNRRFAGMNRLKFRAVTVPDTVLRLTLAATDDKLSFRYESRAGLHATGTICFDCDGHDW